MRSREEFERGARAGAPFSSWAAEEGWTFRVCRGEEIPERACVHAADCPLLAIAAAGRTPAEWSLGARPACSEKTTPGHATKAPDPAAVERSRVEAEFAGSLFEIGGETPHHSYAPRAQTNQEDR